MIRIFVENNELDINASFTHQITYAVNDLQNLDSKSTAFTKTIVLPGTANNNKIFGNIFEFANSNFTNDYDKNIGYNFNASKSAKARIDSDGLTIMKGVIRMLEIIVDGHLIEYEVALFGELGGFFTNLGNKKLEELDFGAYNHTYSATNIVNSWANANAGEGYYYPLIDYGNVSTDKKNYDYRAFRPALFVKQIIDKIITGNGYTWESNFFNTSFFKRLIIPNNQDRLTTVKTQALSSNIGYNWNNATINAKYTFINIIGDTFTPTDYESGNPTSLTYNSITATFNTSISMQGRAYFLGAAAPSGIIFDVEFLLNGTVINSQRYTILYRVGGNNWIDFLYTYNGSLNLNNNDKIELRTKIISRPSGGYIKMATDNITSINIISPIPIVLPAQLNDNITLNSTLPLNIKQKDFFASILKMFYLMVTEDKMIEKHLKIEPYVDFYDTDRTTYIDWSDKIDRNAPIRIKPMSELNARYYQLIYKPDTDWKNEEYKNLYNEGYGDRIYDNGLEFVKETDKTEVIFSATVLIGYVLNNVQSDKIVSAIYKRNNGLEQQIASNIRILQAKQITGKSSWYIRNNGANISSALTNYGYAGHLDNPDAPNSDINFGATKELYFTLVAGALSNNLFNAYYSSYIAEITDKDSRLLTVKMHLTNKDIFNLDFGRFIWIDGVLYRLIKIYDYAEGELCKVDLLRVIYTTYYL